MYRSNGRRAAAASHSKRNYVVIVRTALEAQYVNFIRRELGQPVQLTMADAGLDTEGLLNLARQKDRAARVRGGNAADEVWCFVDGTVLPIEPGLLPPRVRIASSTPEFSFWILLHFESTPTARTGAEVVQALQAHIPSLVNGSDESALAPLLGRYEFARMAALALAESESELGSTVFQFVDSMRQSIYEYNGPGSALPKL